MRTFRPRNFRCGLFIAAVAILPLPFSTTFLGAQQSRISIDGLPGGYAMVLGASDRAVLGVILAADSRGETSGVRVESVQADGPASRSGIKAGDVITSINGVSLRVSEADADDPALSGIASRRLARTLGKAKAGEAVSLQVSTGSTSRTVSVKTVSAAELNNSARSERTEVFSRSSNDGNQGVIGVSIGGSGNARDTLGLFVNSVVTDGPAEKAGIVEGERIASVNGVDVRVPREDLEDMSGTSARANRFVREVQKVAPGGTISLRVYSAGRYRDVSVKAVKRSELPRGGFQMSIGDGGMTMTLPRIPNAFNGTTGFPRDLFDTLSGALRIEGNARAASPTVIRSVRRRVITTE